jgi:hypothetical protein
LAKSQSNPEWFTRLRNAELKVSAARFQSGFNHQPDTPLDKRHKDYNYWL